MAKIFFLDFNDDLTYFKFKIYIGLKMLDGIRSSLLKKYQEFKRPSNTTLTLFVVGFLGATTFAIGFAGLGAQASRNWWASGLKNLKEAGSIVMLTGGSATLAALAVYLVRDKLPANISLQSLKTLASSRSETAGNDSLVGSETGLLPKEIEDYLKKLHSLPEGRIFTAFLDTQEKQWIYVTITSSSGSENTLTTEVFKDDNSTANDRLTTVCHGLPYYYDMNRSDFPNLPSRWQFVQGTAFPILNFEQIVGKFLGNDKATSQTIKKEIVCMSDFNGKYILYFSDPSRAKIQYEIIEKKDSKSVTSRINFYRGEGYVFLTDISVLLNRQ